jgi:hypothetical protein
MTGWKYEWCSTLWQAKAYPFRVTDEWTAAYLGKDEGRVIRGTAARAAARNGRDPDDRYRLGAFRVVRLPANPGTSGL